MATAAAQTIKRHPCVPARSHLRVRGVPQPRALAEARSRPRLALGARAPTRVRQLGRRPHRGKPALQPQITRRPAIDCACSAVTTLLNRPAHRRFRADDQPHRTLASRDSTVRRRIDSTLDARPTLEPARRLPAVPASARSLATFISESVMSADVKTSRSRAAFALCAGIGSQHGLRDRLCPIGAASVGRGR